MSSEVSIKIEYIQQLFLEVQNYMQNHPDLDNVISFLDSEPSEFRSIAYESASMEIGLDDLSKGTELHEWKEFYFRSGEVHSFHMDIGLGWAFAKTGIFPALNWEPLHPLMRWMVFDGIGYFHSLFRGRRTVKNHMVPEGIEGQDLQGFDQGIGRRLWYIGNGEVRKVTQLIQPFPLSRHPDLWRGVGIACGYVGGCKLDDLELLSIASGEYKPQLSAGIALAAISRSISKSETDDIKTACDEICEMSFEEIAGNKSKIVGKENPEEIDDHWIIQLESGFAKIIH